MRRSVRLAAGAVAVVTVLALPPAAAPAPSATSFVVTGFEYAFTPTVGYFAGAAAGNGDRGAWNTYVEHDPLGSTPTYITGGSFWMATRSQTGTYDWVTGTYVHHGGTITTIDPGANCTNQRYLVAGTLENVATSTTTAGTGTFAVTLTHYRALLFGRCITYSASVVGTATFDY